MRWWQLAFSSSSDRHHHSDDEDAHIGGDRDRRRRFFFHWRHRDNARAAPKIRHFTRNQVDVWPSPSDSDHSRETSTPASPQPLPLPDLHVLMRGDRKAASTPAFGVPLPSPDIAQNLRGGCDDRERERDGERQSVDGFNGLNRLVAQDGFEHSETHSFGKSTKKQNVHERSSNGYCINIPISAPATPYMSPRLSPPSSDMLATHYTAPAGVFRVWSEPEMAHPDGKLGLGLHHPMPSEKIVSTACNSPPESPRVGSSLHVGSPPRAASILPPKISSETPTARKESNAQASVHPLPLPPGAGMPSQSNSVPPVSPMSDFSGASMPSQPTSISTIATKPEIPGANMPAQPSSISQVAGKPELMPIKSQWSKGKLIGRGTFGSVYVGSNRETGALCAMKEVEILPDDSKSAERMRQLEQEIEVLSNLKHPNIVQYYGSEVIGDKFYIYLEYVHPGSINKFIHDHCGAITESVIRNFTRHILSGLAYLHSTKTIHRDIKGANLLVDACGVVKLADFGMAKHLNGQTANLSLKGSPYWLAPELLQSVMQNDGSSDVALAVDIWSLGCTIIEMMNGKPPWSEYEGAAALFKVLKETPPIPETLSADGKDFLQLCFCRNPADRPTASMLLDHPFVKHSQHADACTQLLKQIKLTLPRVIEPVVLLCCSR